MIHEPKLELARRAVACKGWRWMGGMLIIHTPRHDGATGYVSRLPQDGYRPQPGNVPDLNDPATLGCLLHLVREAYIAPTLYTRPNHDGWSVLAGSGKGKGKLTDASTEAEALVSALEAAP